MFVATQADCLYREPPPVPQGQSAEVWVPAFREAAREIKAVLAHTEQQMRLYVPSIRSNPEKAPDAFVLTSAEMDAFTKDPDGWAAWMWERRKDEFLKCAGLIA